jgi:hypothetical protein
MKLSYPSAAHGSGAMPAPAAASATSSGSNPRCARRRAVFGPGPFGPVSFGLQCRDSLLDQLRRDSLALELEPDCCVSTSALGEAGGPLRGEAAVVDYPRVPKSNEGCLRRARLDPGAREPVS